MCDELITDSMPLLKQSANHTAKYGPESECYVLNLATKQPHMLLKFRFFGHLLGWALRNGCQLPIQLPRPLWHRLISGPTYQYSLDDLNALDSHLWRFLSQMIQASSSQDCTTEAFKTEYIDQTE